jgi:hypothetical protein
LGELTSVVVEEFALPMPHPLVLTDPVESQLPSDRPVFPPPLAAGWHRSPSHSSRLTCVKGRRGSYFRGTKISESHLRDGINRFQGVLRWASSPKT